VRKLARFISIAGHPMVLLPIAIGVSTNDLLSRADTIIALALILGTLVIFGAVVLWQVRRGVWSDIDVSRREQRPKMYLLAIGLTALGLAYVELTGRPAPMVRGNLATLAVLTLGLVLNQTTNKVSMHAAFDVFAAAILATAYPGAGLGFLVVACLVAASRVVLGRHTAKEAALGLVVGVAGGALLFA
jgi:membrane-associated phospholipid phosphatase